MAVRVSKLEWMAQRLAEEEARGLWGGKHFDWSTRQWLKPNGEPISRGTKGPNPLGREGSLSKQLERQLQNEINRAAIDKAPKGSTITANIPSTCLASLTFKVGKEGAGIATAEFYRGGSVIYQYEMSKEEFADWINSGSLGKYGNGNVF